jgi:catecholate siderophore receptor
VRKSFVGVRAYPRKRPAYGLAALAAGAALGAFQAALAADTADAVDADAATVSQVQVDGKRNPLDKETVATSLTTIQDTPQQISVIDAAQWKNQGIATLEQALRNVPGITVAIGEGGTLSGDQFKIRGFDSKDDVYIDGLRDFGAYTRDSFNYEEVQVLKGPSGAMFGRGTTGGAINTISKRPRLEDFASVDGYVGNGDYYRALGDINRRLGDTTAVRLTVMGNDTGVVDRDLIYAKRWGAAVTLATGLTTDTTASISYLHQHSKGRPDYGIIIVQPPGSIIAKPASEYDVGVERSTFTGFRNDLDKSDADILTVRVSHQVNDKLSLTSDTRFGAYRRYFQYSTLDQCNAACVTALFDGNPATEPQGGIGGSSPYDSDAWGLQNISTLRSDYDLGSLKNQAILGIDLSRQENDKNFLAYTLPPGIATRPAMPHPFVNPNPAFPAGYTLFRPAPGANLTCPATGNCTTNVLGATVFSNVAGTGVLESHGQSTDVAAFITDRIWLTENLSLIGSLRYDRYVAELTSTTYAGLASPVGGVKVKSDLWSPRVSAVFEPTGDQTYYVSWGQSETPQGTSIVGAGTAVAVTAKDLKPETSEIFEAGAKVLIPGTQLSATASIFQIKKDNALQTDSNTGFLLAQSGEKQEVRGVEFSVTGRIVPNWTVTAGYAYLDAEIKESFSNCTVAAANATGTPTAITCPVGVTAAIPLPNTIAIGEQVQFVPKHSANFYTTYDLSDWIDGVSVGGDIAYQSKQHLVYQGRSVSFADRATLTPTRLGIAPESVTVNAFAAWRTGNYRFSVNAYNLTNELYYSQVFSNRATPAAGRTVIFAVGATF